MGSTEEDNAAQLRIFSSSNSWPNHIINMAEDIQHSLGCEICSYVKYEHS